MAHLSNKILFEAANDYNKEEIKKICKDLGLNTQGNFVVLFHGTSKLNYKKILKSGMLKSGTWLSHI